jgi:Bacterial membrane protein YfhO
VRAFLVAAGIVTILWLAAAATWVAGDTVVPWDSKNQFYAFFRFLADALHSGASPFWNPYHYGGHPSIADPQSLIFAPLFFVWALFDPAPSIRAFDLLVYAHLLIGGISMAAIGWRARWPLPANILAAALFMLAGAASGRLQHTGIIISYGLFPLAWLTLQLALQRRSLGFALCFAVSAATLALGRNQVALLLCYLLAAAAIAEIVTAERPLRYLRERLPALSLMALAGAALLAVPLLLTLQFAELSNRPGEPLDEALKGSIHPVNLATLAVANIFGTHGSYFGPNAVSLPEVAHTDDSFNYLFVGWLPVLLLMWFGIAGGGAWKRGRRLITVTLAIALLFMLGRYTPLFGLAFAWIPGIDMFRRPADASFVFSAALALLCGHLLTDYIRNGLAKRGLAEAHVAIGAFTVLASAVAFSSRSGHGFAALIEVAKVIAIPLLAVAALLFLKTAAARANIAAVLATVAILELMGWNTAFRLNAEPRENYAVLERPTGAEAEAMAIIDREIEHDRARGDRPRVEVAGLGGAWQNVAMVRGWSAINGYNPLRIGDYDRLVAPGESNWRAEQRKFPASFRSYDCALARALGLKYLVLGRPIENMPHPQAAVVVDTLRNGPKIWVYRLNNPMPRLKFTSRVQIADANATSPARQAQFDYAQDRVLLENSATRFRTLGPRLARDNAGRVKIMNWQPGWIEIEADSEAGGVLAMHATSYPGWIAQIDGQEVPVLRADHLFRAVEVPPGNHRIIFAYRPLSWSNLKQAAEMVLR